MKIAQSFPICLAFFNAFAQKTDYSPRCIDFCRISLTLICMSIFNFSHALNLLFHNRFAAAQRIAVLAGFMFMCSPAQAQTMWCPADLNQDHRVNVRDLSILLRNWGPTSSRIPADLNQDGQVNGLDLRSMLDEFGCLAETITPNTAYALCEFVDTIDSTTDPYPLTPGWQIVWQPVVSSGTCYAIVLQATEPTNVRGNLRLLPMYAIAIQGTQNKVDAAFDMAVTPQLAFDPIDSAKIGQGSTDALNCILNLAGTNNGVTQSLSEFIYSLGADDNLFVTGHSLGGNITSVLTPWIAFNVPAFGGRMLPLTYLPRNLCAMTFAAPTAGNTAFATFLNNNPISYQAFFNSNDVVPNAWAITGGLNLNRINNLYLPTTIPGSVKTLLASKKLAMAQAGVAYAQTNGVTFTFPLGIPPTGTSDPWIWQVGYQHNNAYCAQFLGSGSCGTSIAAPNVTNAVLNRLAIKRARAASDLRTARFLRSAFRRRLN